VNTVIETSARRRPLNRFDFEGNAKMKTSILIAAIAACALSVPIAFAQDQAAPDKPAMGMDMGQQMSRMQQNMTAMQAQMEQIRATSDPTERRKLLQAHMQAMQDNMKAMGGMGGPMMMGGGQPGGMAKGDGKPMAGGDMMQRHQMMENRMSMMHLMMEQMLQHQQAMESMPAK
jgi:periplasmic protein CpxP/Spy